MDEPPPNPEPQPRSTRRLWPTDFQHRTLWMALTAAALLAIAAISVYVIGVFARVLQFLQPVLVPVALAGILAYLLEPIVRRLTNRGTPRFRAMISVWIAFHALLLLLFLSVAVPTISQGARIIRSSRHTWVQSASHFIGNTVSSIDRFLASFSPEKDRTSPTPAETDDPLIPPRTHSVQQGESPGSIAAIYGISTEELELANAGRTFTPGLILSLPESAQRLTLPEDKPGARKPFADPRLTSWLARHSNEITSRTLSFLGNSFQGAAGAFGYLVGFLLVPLYLYYFLKESAAIQKNWSNYLPLRASRFKAEVVSCLSEINGYLIAFFRGQMLVSLIDGFFVGLSLAIIGLPYALLVGVFVALLGLIPYVGNILCWLAAVIISISHFSQTTADGTLLHSFAGIEQIWAYPLLVTLIFIVVQQINSLVTAPRIVGDAVGLHPLTVIFSVLFWSLLIGGLLGALLAVPLTASVKVIFRRYIWERRVHPRNDGTHPETAAAST